MYSGHSGQRRGLLRPVTATNDGPIFRNLPLLGFLMGLLFFFFIFNIYQAQSAELYDMRNQIKFERSRHIKVKSENIECSEKLAKRDSTLLSYMINLKQLQNDKNTCFTSLDLMKAELALAKLTLTNLRTNSALMESVLEAPKKTVESLKAQLQGKDVEEDISQDSNLSALPLVITQSANGLTNRKNISVQREKLANKTEHSQSPSASTLSQQKTVLPQPVALGVPERIVVTVKSSNNPHVATVHAASVPRIDAQHDQLNFLSSPLQLKQSLEAKKEENPMLPNIPKVQLNNVVGMNEQFPFIQKKDQIKKNVENGNDSDRKQVIGGENIDKEAEGA
ncbi:unnamed protein product [Cercopithifilaria johnstoni]|uniref:Uncharacterized protein n=1 Tax=Cercopithifilaria johnstoni TaxID=2874296 RepID=A0A8J2Q313_9BILA|nr:unnamed protein product [Cercopithifilaria johnstoni]